MRSLSGMNDDRQLSSVVFPEPVPPEMRMFSRDRTIARRTVTMSDVSDPRRMRSSTVSGLRPKRRIESSGPSSASGGMIALTREPSGRRASTIGELSSTRRPIRDTMRSMICMRCASSRKITDVGSSLPRRST
jgi:hypothetical protein